MVNMITTINSTVHKLFERINNIRDSNHWTGKGHLVEEKIVDGDRGKNNFQLLLLLPR